MSGRNRLDPGDPEYMPHGLEHGGLDGLPLMGGSDPVAHRGGPSTAQDAAKASREPAKGLRAACYRAVKAAGTNGLNHDECADVLDLVDAQASRRLSELRTAGHLVRLYRERPTRSGCMAKVYVTPGNLLHDDEVQ